jgi:phosphoglycolate phosphatase
MSKLFNNIESVIFDFDGVIADTGKDIVASVQATQKHYNLPELDYTTIMSYVGHGAKYLIDCSMKQLSQEDCAEALKWYKDYYKNHPCDKTSLYDGFENVVAQLAERGISMSIVSNKPEAITLLVVEQLGIAKYFTKIIGPESVSKMKPDPEGLLLCLDAMGASAENSIMVGDSFTDIQAGKAAGMHTCAILYGYGDKDKLKAENADYSASATNEIINF